MAANIDKDSNRDEAKELQRVTLKFECKKAIKRKKKGKTETVNVTHAVCFVRKSTAIKLGVEPSSPITKEGDRIFVNRGSKGTKSYRLLYADEGKTGVYSSYSLPVPGWVNLSDFFLKIYPQIKTKPVSVISPDGRTYGTGMIEEIQEDKSKTTDNK